MTVPTRHFSNSCTEEVIFCIAGPPRDRYYCSHKIIIKWANAKPTNVKREEDISRHTDLVEVASALDSVSEHRDSLGEDHTYKESD